MEIEKFREKFTALLEKRLSFEEGKEFLSRLYQEGVNGEILGEGAKIMRKFARPFPLPQELKNRVIDLVGTGGDKSGSFNISSTSALAVSGAGGIVVKHGNRSVTSRSGSADMLEKLGVNLSPSVQLKMVEKVRFAFLFAPNYHPAMAHIMPIRKSLPHPTIFNLLGPLVNPANPPYYLLGVYSRNLLDPMAVALQKLGIKRGLVVSSYDGLDELSISAPTEARLVTPSSIETLVIEPTAYGVSGKREGVKGGDAQFNSRLAAAILKGEERGDPLKAVLLNGGVALWVAEVVGSIGEGIEMLREKIEKGEIGDHLERVIRVSEELNE
jgi:anthranilate phosphoribosyltransferase